MGRARTLGTILIFGMGKTMQTNRTMLKMLTEKCKGEQQEQQEEYKNQEQWE